MVGKRRQRGDLLHQVGCRCELPGSMAAFCSGIATCLQGRVGPVGSNLLSIMGTSVVFLNVLAASGRLGRMMGLD